MMKIRTHQTLDGQFSKAVYSDCMDYRYMLCRFWEKRKRPVAYLMLNPSTATELQNDPTVERCHRRAIENKYGGFYVYNIFAYRATDPKDMKACAEPVGEHNDRFLKELFADVKRGAIDLVCGWGNHGLHQNRQDKIFSMMVKYDIAPKAYGWNMSGSPKHPLYIAYKAEAEVMPRHLQDDFFKRKDA